MTDAIKIPAELKQVLEFMQAVPEQYEGVATIYNAVEAPLRAEWDKLPGSAQKVVESFEQFQAVVSYTLVGPCAELLQMIEKTNEGDAEADEQQADAMMQQLFSQGIKMMIKDLKAARRDIPLRNELIAPFKA
ncbi:DUF3069 domain-containing protein [Ferrimonas lipolytica]|uniref:DUF3069 domain-containing protein n=1 Tax=Ferrimonas lipolytica TaxID=2724191 RepID=A0A6H1UBR8_9GAMM|nr:DUF3069 domain-containing protein [Ferrimonas lipolytica]QIZ76505.1 DUF3069 domain-containing protein [Ferrimonas lipolytica]